MSDRRGSPRAQAHRWLCAHLSEARAGALTPAAGDLSPAAREMTQGTLRRVNFLDSVLDAYLDRPLACAPEEAAQALRLGALDLLLRRGVPAPKVVSEAVALMGGLRRGRGLVNAVLRKVAAGFSELPAAPASPDERSAWLGGNTWARFDRPVLPDPRRAPLDWLSRHYSLPRFAVEAFTTELPLEAGAFFRASVERLPLALQPLPPTTEDDLSAELAEAGVEVIGRRGGILEVRTLGRLSRVRALGEGRASAQDLVAGAVVPFLGPQPRERVLDLCAPPGGKAVQISRALGPGGELVAAHLPGRAGRLREGLANAGVRGNWRLHDLGDQGEDLPPGPFDRILIDAPCSNSGVLMKRVEARYRLKPEPLESLEKLQDALLDRALECLAPAGVLVYSTCSVLTRENGERVRAALTRHAPLALEEERLRYPHRTGRDGGYMARLRRSPNLG